MELGETTEQAAQREAREEACALSRSTAARDVQRGPDRPGTDHVSRAAVSPDVAAGPESEEVALVALDDIPWEQLAFPTVVWALAHFHESRGKSDFATYSNPTGDLARMWPPRKPAGL